MPKSARTGSRTVSPRCLRRSTVRPYVGAAAAVATLRRYPRAFFYGMQLSLGVNEFGTSRGFEIVTIPAAYYDDAAKCLKGGNKPDSTSTATLCAGASGWYHRCPDCDRDTE